MGTTVYIPIYDRIKNIVISKDLINLVYPNIKEVLGDDYKYAIDKETHYANNKILFEQYNIVFSGLGEQLFEISLHNFTDKCKKIFEPYGYHLIYSRGDIFISYEPLRFISTRGIEGYFIDFCETHPFETEAEGIILTCNKLIKEIKELLYD